MSDSDERRGVAVPSVADFVRRRATVRAIGRGVAVGCWVIALWKLFRYALRELVDEGLMGGYLEVDGMIEVLVGAAAFVGVGFGVFFLAGPLARLIVRPGRPGCPGCGYDVDASAERCPECGLEAEQMRPTVIAAGDRWDEGVRRHRVMVMAGWVRLLAGFVAIMSIVETTQAAIMIARVSISAQLQGIAAGVMGDATWLIAPTLTALLSLAMFRYAVAVAGIVVPRVQHDEARSEA